jgi:CHAD domain-containing protein
LGTETEVKMGAWAGFEMPALDGVAEDVSAVSRAPRTLLAVYYDTADLRLARWGVTVRHRTGDTGGARWTVKLPEGENGPALVRRELNFEGPPGRMPAEAVSLITAYARDTPLVPVARIRTVRTGIDLLDHEGAVVAEVVDDEVSVLHGGRVASRFREVEVEIGTRPPAGLLDDIRALGPRALEPPEVVPPSVGKRPSAAQLVRHAIATAVERILRHDPGVRIGDDPEDVHQARVGTRTLRSDLRTFAPLLEEKWTAGLRDDLRRLGGALGAVRDADVLIERLRRQAAQLPEPDTAALAPLFRRLAKERDDTRAVLLDVMGDARYVELLGRLVAAAADPPCRRSAQAPAAEVVPGLVIAPWHKLAKAVKALPAEPADAELHRIRILAKRARYAAEAAAPLAGKEASALAGALSELQTVLGAHQDAVVAEAWLRAATAGPDGVSLAAGELIGMERAEAADARRRWPKAWSNASDKKLRSWL